MQIIDHEDIVNISGEQLKELILSLQLLCLSSQQIFIDEENDQGCPEYQAGRQNGKKAEAVRLKVKILHLVSGKVENLPQLAVKLLIQLLQVSGAVAYNLILAPVICGRIIQNASCSFPISSMSSDRFSRSSWSPR